MNDFLERCIKGDIKARKELYLDSVDNVFGLALKITKNRDIAKDISQQVFIKVFDRIAQFRNQSEISTWIYRITTNLCLDLLKSSSHKTLSLDEEGVKQYSQNRLSKKADQSKSAVEEVVRKVLKTIDPEWAKTFWLYTMEDVCQKDIAKIQKISIPTVKMRLSKVRKILKEKIDRNDV